MARRRRKILEERYKRKSPRYDDVPVIVDSHKVSGDRSTAFSGLSLLRIPKWYRVTSAVLLLSLLAALIPGVRTYILRSAGRMLVTQEPSIKSADIIVVAIDADGAGTLGAADLAHRAVSNRIAVFTDPPSLLDREFLRRGLPYEDRAAVSTRQLQSLANPED